MWQYIDCKPMRPGPLDALHIGGGGFSFPRYLDAVRPGTENLVLEIDVPRPRTLIAMVENDRANEIKMQALSILHEEAMKSFSRGSKAAADFVEAYSRRVAKP